MINGELSWKAKVFIKNYANQRPKANLRLVRRNA